MRCDARSIRSKHGIVVRVGKDPLNTGGGLGIACYITQLQVTLVARLSGLERSDSLRLDEPA